MQEREAITYIKVALGARLGVASTNSLDIKKLKAALEKACYIAKHSPKHPGFKEFPSSEKQPDIKTHHKATANFSVENKLALLQKIFTAHKKHKMNPAGSFTIGEEETAVVSSAGIKKYQPSTFAGLKLISTKNAASGFASWISRDIGELDADKLTETSIQKCAANKNPRPVALGKYDCILEPQAVADILGWLSYIGFGAKAFCERTSFLSGRIGEKIMSEDLTIYDDGYDTRGFAIPFDCEGVNKQKTAFIDKGIAGKPVFDSEYAYMNEGKSTGHALDPDSTIGPLPLNLAIEPGASSLEEMTGSLKRGILITRFHYISGLLNTRQAVMTGMTRDGAFKIENGKIKHAVPNMRFTQSILEAFSKIAAISKERILAGDLPGDELPCLVPALLIKDFTFTGKS